MILTFFTFTKRSKKRETMQREIGSGHWNYAVAMLKEDTTLTHLFVKGDADNKYKPLSEISTTGWDYVVERRQDGGIVCVTYYCGKEISATK